MPFIQSTLVGEDMTKESNNNPVFVVTPAEENPVLHDVLTININQQSSLHLSQHKRPSLSMTTVTSFSSTRSYCTFSHVDPLNCMT